MFNLLDTALIMERRHDSHCDPILLENDPSCIKYGLIGLCTAIWEEYGENVKNKAWTALATKISQGNLGKLKDPSKVGMV